MESGIKINIEDYNYELPPERIAQYPSGKREQSKLLLYKTSTISHDIFSNIKNHLPSKSLLIFNDTKVIHARLIFKKETGAPVEIFCLEPAGQQKDLQLFFQQKGSCDCKCLIGNNKRWKQGLLKIENQKEILYAEKIKQEGEYFIVRFSWEPQHFCFSEILEGFGKVPLPPYIKRIAKKSDGERYQTVFAKHEGSVAAPTAGLHFTEDILHTISLHGIKRQYLTLHIGAGTFKPVSAHNISDHEMHKEHFSVSRQLLESILKQGRNPVIPVGTTSLRTLESIYWLGVKQLLKKENGFFLDQWESYQLEEKQIHVEDALSALLRNMDNSGILYLSGCTKMIIVPGYYFKLANGIITNFHQPRSTLLLLVAAMLGDKWKEVYTYALENDFRFLSYGDCCLFLNNFSVP